MTAQTLTPQARERFLETLRTECNVTLAARAVGVTRRYMYDVYKDEPDFAKQWDDALEEGYDRLEREAQRRAFEGNKKPVFQQGAQVGYIREYSDTLAMFLMRAHRPARFRERQEIEHKGQIDVAQRILAGRKRSGNVE